MIHAIARQWTVDGQGNVQQPMGMTAYRLEVGAHIVTGSSTAVNNLVQCVMAHGVDVDELVLEPLASNRTVLRPEERHMGVAVVDIGGGTTDVAIFIEEGLCHTQILDLGGNHLTNDLAVGLHAPYETAEGKCVMAMSCRSGSLQTKKYGPRSLARKPSVVLVGVLSVRC